MKIRALLILAMLTIVLIVTKLITAQTDDCGLATSEDADGLVVIESENLPIADTDWSIKQISITSQMQVISLGTVTTILIHLEMAL
jgi:hypothetical protein